MPSRATSCLAFMRSLPCWWARCTVRPVSVGARSPGAFLPLAGAAPEARSHCFSRSLVLVADVGEILLAEVRLDVAHAVRAVLEQAEALQLLLQQAEACLVLRRHAGELLHPGGLVVGHQAAGDADAALIGGGADHRRHERGGGDRALAEERPAETSGEELAADADDHRATAEHGGVEEPRPETAGGGGQRGGRQHLDGSAHASGVAAPVAAVVAARVVAATVPPV